MGEEKGEERGEKKDERGEEREERIGEEGSERREEIKQAERGGERGKQAERGGERGERMTPDLSLLIGFMGCYYHCGVCVTCLHSGSWIPSGFTRSPIT